MKSSLIVEVCRIDKIKDHPNADKLEYAVVKGWECIVLKDTYKEGDLVTFVPPDAIFEESVMDEYNLEYLRQSKGRVKTIRLRGYISQGIVLSAQGKPLGTDMMKFYKITKWEPKAPKYHAGLGKTTAKKLNPLFDKYNKPQHFKNFSSLFYEGEDVVMVEKIHGTNFRAGNLPIAKEKGILGALRYFWKTKIKKQTYEFCFGSMNMQFKDLRSKGGFYKKNVYAQIAKKYRLDEVVPAGLIIYGEIYGSGIQDLTYGKGDGDIDLAVFDIKDSGTNRYLYYPTMESWVKMMKLPLAPEVYRGPFSVEALKEHTSGKSLLCGSQIREGVVCRSLQFSFDNRVGRKFVKSVSPEYLTRGNATEYN